MWKVLRKNCAGLDRLGKKRYHKSGGHSTGRRRYSIQQYNMQGTFKDRTLALSKAMDQQSVFSPQSFTSQ